MRLIFKILIIIAIVLVSLFFAGLIFFMLVFSSMGDDTPPLCIESFPSGTFNSEAECQEYRLQEIQKMLNQNIEDELK